VKFPRATRQQRTNAKIPNWPSLPQSREGPRGYRRVSLADTAGRLETFRKGSGIQGGQLRSDAAGLY